MTHVLLSPFITTVWTPVVLAIFLYMFMMIMMMMMKAEATHLAVPGNLVVQ